LLVKVKKSMFKWTRYLFYKYLLYFVIRLYQYQLTLQTSKDRLKLFYEQLNNHYKNKQEFTISIIEKEKRIQQLKTNLSNLGVK